MPTGDGSAPTNIECRSSWSARSAFSMRRSRVRGRAPAWCRRTPRRRRSGSRPRRRAARRSATRASPVLPAATSRQPPPVVGRVQHRLLREVVAPRPGRRRCPASAAPSRRRANPSARAPSGGPTGTRAGRRGEARPSSPWRRLRLAPCTATIGSSGNWNRGAGRGTTPRLGAGSAARRSPRSALTTASTSAAAIIARRSRNSFDSSAPRPCDRRRSCSRRRPTTCLRSPLPPAAADLERRAALPGQESVVAPRCRRGASRRRCRARAPPPPTAPSGVPSSRSSCPVNAPRSRSVSRRASSVARLEARDRQRTDHVVVVAAERDPHARRPRAGCRRTSAGSSGRERHAVDAAVQQRRRAATTGWRRTPRSRLVGQRRADLARHRGHGLRRRSAVPAAAGRLGSRTNRLADVRFDRDRGAGRRRPARAGTAGVSTHGVDRAPAERVQQLVEAVGVVGGVERVERRVGPPARHHVGRGVAVDAVGGDLAMSSSGSWSAKRFSTES